MCENFKEELKNLDIFTLEMIVNNEKLQLNDEDQLLNFINELYSNDQQYSILYDSVHFSNVSTKSICDFVGVYDINDISVETWRRFVERLTDQKSIEKDQSRYINNKVTKSKLFLPQNVISGIINHLKNEVDITSSSVIFDRTSYQPKNVALFNDDNSILHSSDAKNSWICFDFKKHRVIPTDYTIKASNISMMFSNERYPKSWIVEGSIDKKSWDVLDNKVDCDAVKGENRIHTFKMKQQSNKEYRFIRFRLTGPCWSTCYYLVISAFEINGKLI